MLICYGQVTSCLWTSVFLPVKWKGWIRSSPTVPFNSNCNQYIHYSDNRYNIGLGVRWSGFKFCVRLDTWPWASHFNMLWSWFPYLQNGNFCTSKAYFIELWRKYLAKLCKNELLLILCALIFGGKSPFTSNVLSFFDLLVYLLVLLKIRGFFKMKIWMWPFRKETYQVM